jgi:hypothetical protein
MLDGKMQTWAFIQGMEDAIGMQSHSKVLSQTLSPGPSLETSRIVGYCAPCKPALDMGDGVSPNVIKGTATGVANLAALEPGQVWITSRWGEWCLSIAAAGWRTQFWVSFDGASLDNWFHLVLAGYLAIDLDIFGELAKVLVNWLWLCCLRWLRKVLYQGLDWSGKCLHNIRDSKKWERNVRTYGYNPLVIIVVGWSISLFQVVQV